MTRESVLNKGAAAGVRRAAVFGCVLVALLGESRVSGAGEASSLNVIEFRMRVREKGGVVRCGLFERSGWLKKPVASATARADGPTALCVFHNVSAGTYGLSAFHDQNENGKLDTNLLGMPIEDYCASNDARGVFGPPSFEDAKFRFRGKTLRLEAHLK